MLGGGNDKDIKDLLKQVLSENKRLDKGVSQVVLEDVWKAEMGDIIVSYTERLYFQQGKLIVYLSSAPLRSELSMSKSKLIKLLNDACGREYVKEIILR